MQIMNTTRNGERLTSRTPTKNYFHSKRGTLQQSFTHNSQSRERLLGYKTVAALDLLREADAFKPADDQVFLPGEDAVDATVRIITNTMP
jgi:hypothetical protein